MNKLRMHSPDLTQANIDKLAAIADLFPNCVTESRDAKGQLSRSVDFDQLRQELSTSIVEGPQERYQRRVRQAAGQAFAATSGVPRCWVCQ